MKIAEMEIDLHGLTVEEALPKLDDFIFKSFSAGFKTLCINHGHGSGILRQAVHRELKKKGLVKSFRSGDRFEGGKGVTIVTLKVR
jgi:DNA mismatch repair protein MutS2